MVTHSNPYDDEDLLSSETLTIRVKPRVLDNLQDESRSTIEDL